LVYCAGYELTNNEAEGQSTDPDRPPAQLSWNRDGRLRFVP
jgi:hypothetical protein